MENIVTNNMEKPKKNYSARWTLEQERDLIKARIRFDTSFQSKNCNPRQCWMKVIEESKLDKTVKNVTQKWQNILKKYKRMIQPQSGVSTEDGEFLPTQWELFDELHDFLKNKHGLHPTYIIDQDISDSAGPSHSTSRSSSRMSDNSENIIMKINSDHSDDDTDHFLPEKRIKKGNNNNKQDMIKIMKETSDDVRKSVRNLEKLVEFATRQMFPNAQFRDLE